jgi:hypothetical protein
MANKKFESNAVFNGEVETTKLKVTSAGGDEGGEVLLGKPETNTTIAGTGVTVDVYQNKLRFFEQGGDARGYYLDITGGGGGAGTNIIGGGSASDSFKTISVTGQDNVVADSSTDTLSLVAGTNVSITTNATSDSITINSTGNFTSVDSIKYPDYITFDTTPETEPTEAGSLWWNPDFETLNVQLDSAVTLQVGQEHVIRVKNDSGSVAIPEMRVVMFAGATGDTVEVTPALSTASYDPHLLVGVTTEQIPADGFGFVTQFGFINKVDTSTPGWSLGDLLYADPANAGLLTNVKPSAPNWNFPIAAVTRVHASTGRILVRTIPGQHLNDLVDVAIDSPADNEVLAYNSGSGVWINQTASEAGLIDTSATAQTKAGDLTVSTKVVTPRIENTADISIVSDAGSGSANDINIATRYNTIRVSDPSSSVYIDAGDASSYGTWKFDKTSILFPDNSSQSTAFLGMSSYSTTNLSEGTNLYYTDERAQDAIGNSLGTGLSYNDSTGAISNSGVLDLTGTTNEIVVSTSTGSVTIGIPDSPVLVTPNIGVATATSVNGTTIPSSKTLVVTTDIGSTVQGHSSTLDGINTLGLGTGFLKNTAGTWSYDNSTYSTTSHNHTLDSLSNVVITGTPTDGQAIVWDTTTSKWVNETVSGGASYPTQSGNNGKFLQTDGTNVSWAFVDLSSYLTSESDTLETVTDRGASSTNAITISNTTQSTTPTTGALIISGGVGIAKDVWIDGDLHVNGTTVTENTKTVATHDNLIYLNAALDSTVTNAVGDGTYVTYTAENNYTPGMDIRVTGMNPSGYNIATSDLLTVYSATSTQFVVAKTTTGSFVSGGTAHAKEEVNPDLGFAGGYYSGGYAHAGLFRDASDGVFKIFDGYTPEPDEAVNIDTTHASFSFAPIKVESLDVIDASTTRSNLGLVIGTNVQAYNSTLAAVAGGTYTGDDSITTVGAITTGSWNATMIHNDYINDALTIDGGTINSTPIGATTASTGKFTSVDVDGEVLIDTFVGTGSGSEQELSTETSWGSTYSCAEYIVSVSNGTTGRYTSKVMLMSNGSTSSITEYAIQTVGTITPPTITAGQTPSALKLRINAVNGYAITLVRTLVTA